MVTGIGDNELKRYLEFYYITSLRTIMSQVFYNLDIAAPSDKIDIINEILGVRENKGRSYWSYQIIQGDELLNISERTVVLHFLKLLEGKYQLLKEVGIERSDITIWMVYEYDEQCNMEFHPEDTLLLGQNEIVLCISCYQA